MAYPPLPHPAQVDLGDVVRREIKIFGTICYTRQEFESACTSWRTAG